VQGSFEAVLVFLGLRRIPKSQKLDLGHPAYFTLYNRISRNEPWRSTFAGTFDEA